MMFAGLDGVGSAALVGIVLTSSHQTCGPEVGPGCARVATVTAVKDGQICEGHG